MTAARAVTATFNSSATTFALTVTKAGTGAGTVTSSPAGISCGATCSANYASGTSVTLTAAAASGSTFAGWSGACTGTGACTVSMTAARAVTATFNSAVDVRVERDEGGHGHWHRDVITDRHQLRHHVQRELRERHVGDAHGRGGQWLDVRRLERRVHGHGNLRHCR